MLKANKDMEILKLEHIAPFVLSGLKGRNRETKQDYNLLGLDIARNSVYVLGSGTFPGFLNVKLFAPIFHPLSSLTKPIQHNGEEFVPIIELYPLYDRQPDGVEMICSQELGYVESHYYGGAALKFNTNQPLENRYDYVQKLIEWKFNVFNLPSHLWIDVNTLEENPYK